MEGKDLLLILQKHPDLIEDPRRLMGVLKDYFPAERQNIRLLEQALEIDILQEIRANHLDHHLLMRLRKRLMDEFFLRQDKAEWAVSVWGFAYGYGVLGKAMPQPTEMEQPQNKAVPPQGKPVQQQNVQQKTPAPPPAQQQKTPVPPPVQQQKNPVPPPVQQQKTPAPPPAQQQKNPVPPPVQQQKTPAPPPAQQQKKPVPPPAAAPIDMSHFELKHGGRILVEYVLPGHDNIVSSSKVLVKYIGPGGNVVIPQGVTGIKEWAFSVNPQEEQQAATQAFLYGRAVSNSQASRKLALPQIRKIVIPQGVTVIGRNAFTGCSNLQSVTIPQGVAEIGGCAFSGCSSLQDAAIPRGVTYLRDHLFEGCSSLRSVTIPQGVVSIGNSAFKDCSSLQSVIIPPSVTEICAYAFSGCSSLRNVVIPQGVNRIDAGAFSSCVSLQNVVLPQGVILSVDVFKGCSGLRARPGGELETASVNMRHFEFDATCHVLIKYVGPGGDVVIPKGVVSIGERAFSGCAALKSVKIPQGAAYIGEGAFWDCANLQNVTVAPGVTEINARAFGRCPKLRSVRLPNSVKEIHPQVFPYRGKLTLHPLTIYAPAGSYAQQYAKERGLRFRAV